MSSRKLKKYLTYYRKVLSEEPENIEARLRLAVLFREMERPSHAIEEYAMAAKLLASEGLPLEAIAACKAILEIDSGHQETQFFLAKLYARVPEATGDSVRVARPVTPIGGRNGAVQESREFERVASSIRVQDLTRQEAERIRREEEPAITLEEPKSISSRNSEGQAVSVVSAVAPATKPVEEEVQDEQILELGVFNMESLDLEKTRTGNWDEFAFLDELEEPATTELEADEQEERGDGELRMERQFRLSALPEMPLFGRLSREVFLEFLNAMELERIGAGEVVLEPDDPATCLFVIVHGEVRVEKELLDGRIVELARMGEGQVFGEFRLLTGNTGQARVVAQSELEVLTVSDEVVFAIGRKHPEMWEILWEYYFERMLNHSMASGRIFGGLSQEERELVGQHFHRVHVAAGEALFEKGSLVDQISLVVAGAVQVEIPTVRGIQVVEHLSEGAFLGVSPAALEAPATATVRAVTDLVVMNMPGPIFRELIQGLPEVADAVREVIMSRKSKTSRLVDEASLLKLV